MRETKLGYQATLKRRSASTIYGQDIDEVTLDVEFQTNDRVRFKVMKKGFINHSAKARACHIKIAGNSPNWQYLVHTTGIIEMKLIWTARIQMKWRCDHRSQFEQLQILTRKKLTETLDSNVIFRGPPFWIVWRHTQCGKMTDQRALRASPHRLAVYLNNLDTSAQSGQRQSRENEGRSRFSVVSLPGSSRLWCSSSRLPRFPSALKLLKIRQATQAT